jgi:GNAT superfamily N-acetyltransferase
VTIRPLRTEADRAAFQRVCHVAFGSPPELADLIMPSLSFALDPEMVWLLAEVDGEPIGCGGAYRAGSAAVVCCLATLPEHRGRGIGAAVSRATLTHAASAWGSTTAVLRSGPLSVPLYRRLGFRYACQHRTYTRMTNDPPMTHQ